jgi:hypothetical protein
VDIKELTDMMENERYAERSRSIFHTAYINALQYYNCKRLTNVIAASVVKRKRDGLWYPSSRVRTRSKSSDFKKKKKKNISQHAEIKLSVPCRSFTACKRSLNVTW